MALRRTIRRVVSRTVPDGLRHAISMRRPNEPLLPILARHVAGGTFIDIGANNGLFVHHLRASAGRVVAFEPIGSLAAKLRERYPGIEVHECALSNRVGEATLHVPSLRRDAVLSRASLHADANPGFDLEPRTVPVRRLDDFDFGAVKAIKIDVEGHEAAVLEGAARTIGAMRPVLVVEIEERHHPGRSLPLLRWIEALGYASFHHDGTGLASSSNVDFDELQRPEHRKQAFGRANGRYVNNFLFLPS